MIKEINHFELNYRTKEGDIKSLLFMKRDCTISTRNLKTDFFISAGREIIPSSDYDLFELFIKSEKNETEYDHNWDSIRAIKDINPENITSFNIIYTDGSQLLLHTPSDKLWVLKLNSNNEYLHILYV